MEMEKFPDQTPSIDHDERLKSALSKGDRVQIFQINRFRHPFIGGPRINFGVVESFASVPKKIRKMAKKKLDERLDEFTPHVEHLGTLIIDRDNPPINPAKLR